MSLQSEVVEKGNATRSCQKRKYFDWQQNCQNFEINYWFFWRDLTGNPSPLDIFSLKRLTCFVQSLSQQGVCESFGIPTLAHQNCWSVFFKNISVRLKKSYNGNDYFDCLQVVHQVVYRSDSKPSSYFGKWVSRMRKCKLFVSDFTRKTTAHVKRTHEPFFSNWAWSLSTGNIPGFIME